MSEEKTKDQTGKFTKLSSAWSFARKKIIAVSILGLAILILTVGAGFRLLKKKQVASIVSVSQVTGFELPGWWLKDYFGSSVCDNDLCQPTADPDNDKLTNQQEFYYHSDPFNQDTNQNGLTDGEDVAQNFDPSKKGKVTFEQAASDDTVFGESLLFGEDIKKIINESVDPNRIELPKVNDAELNVSSDNSKQAVATYLQASNEIINKYFPNNAENEIEAALNQNDQTAAEALKLSAAKALVDFKKLTIPPPVLQLHKYYLGLLMLLPSIVSVPNQQVLQDETNQVGNLWYDQMQAFAVLLSKIQLENNRLNNQYK